MMTPISILIAAALMSETARVGGSGGNRTVSMDCGSGAFIVGVTASGGRDGTFGFNLVRRIKFTCRAFSGATPGASSTTVEAVSDKQATSNQSNGTASCSTGEGMSELELFAGTFIDRVNQANCIPVAGSGMNWIGANIGGDGGSRQFLSCPFNEALYKVEARVGDAIDSLKGFCRAFATATRSVPQQIDDTGTPSPSDAHPTPIPVGATKVFSFTISNFNATYPTVHVGVTAETDFLGGGSLNLPEFRVELLNPAGVVVASKVFSKVERSTICGPTYLINANGVWKLRVTNLKKDIGTLNVRWFGASGQ